MGYILIVIMVPVALLFISYLSAKSKQEKIQREITRVQNNPSSIVSSNYDRFEDSTIVHSQPIGVWSEHPIHITIKFNHNSVNSDNLKWEKFSIITGIYSTHAIIAEELILICDGKRLSLEAEDVSVNSGFLFESDAFSKGEYGFDEPQNRSLAESVFALSEQDFQEFFGADQVEFRIKTKSGKVDLEMSQLILNVAKATYDELKKTSDLIKPSNI